MSWTDLHLLARDTFGVVTPALAARAGLDRSTVRRRAVREGWARPHPGVLLLPGTPDTAEVARSAALHAVGAPASLSHDTAADQHGFGDRSSSTLHVTVPASRRPTPDGRIEVHRSTTVLPADLRVVRGLPTLAVARTLRDLAPRRPDAALLDLMTVAEQRRLVTLDELVEQARRRDNGAGMNRFRRAVAVRARDRTDSGLETDTVRACRRHGRPPHHGPYPVRCPDGRTVHLDIAWPAATFAIECDGYAFHSDPRAFERDRRRWQQVQEVGWTITWVTRQRLDTDLAGILAEVDAAHVRAGLS